MAGEIKSERSFLADHLRAIRKRPWAAGLLAAFAIATGAGIWMGTIPLENGGLRAFLVGLGILTMVVCGIGYLFPNDEEPDPSP